MVHVGYLTAIFSGSTQVESFLYNGIMNDQQVKFLKVYANLPKTTREEIVVVVDDEPYTWQSVKLEVEEKTELGNKILDIC